MAGELSKDKILFINYENYTYIIRTDKECNPFYSNPILLIDKRLDHTKGYTIKWLPDSNYKMWITCSFIKIAEKEYSFISLNGLWRHSRNDPTNYDQVIDGVIYTHNNVTCIDSKYYDSVVKTPWYIVDKDIVIRQIVWVRQDGKYALGCIPAADLSLLKLDGMALDLLYTTENNNLLKNVKDDSLNDSYAYIRSKSTYVADLVLEYLTDRDILLNMADLPGLKKVMKEKHFNLYYKSRFMALNHVKSVDNYYNDSVKCISSAVETWINKHCTDAILNLIPILVQYGYIDEIALGICKSNDHNYVNLMFGKHINLNGQHITGEYKLFEKTTFLNLIDYCLKNNKIDAAISYLTYHKTLGPIMIKHLIETKSQPMIEWLITSREYNKHLSDFRLHIMYCITDIKLMKLYITKTKPTIENLKYCFDAILTYLIRLVSKHELMEILELIPGAKYNGIESVINKNLEEILFAEVQTATYTTRYMLGKSKGESINLDKFDAIWRNYGSDKSIIYRTSGKVIEGVCGRIIKGYPYDHENLLKNIYCKYNIP